MPKKTIDTLLKYKEIVFAISMVILAALNLFLGTKLAPIVYDIQSLAGRVSAIEVNQTSLADDVTDIKDSLNTTQTNVVKIKCYLIPKECLK